MARRGDTRQVRLLVTVHVCVPLETAPSGILSTVEVTADVSVYDQVYDLFQATARQWADHVLL